MLLGIFAFSFLHFWVATPSWAQGEVTSFGEVNVSQFQDNSGVGGKGRLDFQLDPKLFLKTGLDFHQYVHGKDSFSTFNADAQLLFGGKKFSFSWDAMDVEVNPVLPYNLISMVTQAGFKMAITRHFSVTASGGMEMIFPAERFQNTGDDQYVVYAKDIKGRLAYDHDKFNFSATVHWYQGDRSYQNGAITHSINIASCGAELCGYINITSKVGGVFRFSTQVLDTQQITEVVQSLSGVVNSYGQPQHQVYQTGDVGIRYWFSRNKRMLPNSEDDEEKDQE